MRVSGNLRRVSENFQIGTIFWSVVRDFQHVSGTLIIIFVFDHVTLQISGSFEHLLENFQIS